MAIPDRVAFTLFGKDIYWYGVLMAIGIIIAVVLASLEEKRKHMKQDTVIDMCLVIIPCGIVGARLYYVLFHLERYLPDPLSIFYVWQGGLAIYGAVIFGLLGAFVFSRIRKVRFLQLADCIAPGLVLAQAIGRWGNFFNQEAFGLPVTAYMVAQHPWLQYFPFAVGIQGTHYFEEAICSACITGANGVHLHLATFFYESVWCLLVFLVIWFLRKKFKHDGDMILCYAGLYGFERMFVEGLRGDSLYLVQPGKVAWLASGIRVSQLLSFLLVVAVTVFVLVRWQREKKLGCLIWPAPLPEAEDGVEETAVAEELTGLEADLEEPEEAGEEEMDDEPEEPEIPLDITEDEDILEEINEPKEAEEKGQEE